MSSHLPHTGGLRRPSAAAAATSSSSSTTAAHPSTSRFGFRNAPTVGASTPLGKRTVSNTSMGNDTAGPSATGAPPTAKRTLRADGGRRPLGTQSPASSSPSTSSPRTNRPPSPSASHHLSTLKTDYEERLLLSQQSYDKLEADHRRVLAENERLKSEQRESAAQWDRMVGETTRDRERRDRELADLRSSNAQLRTEAMEREEDLQGLIEDADRDRQEAHSEKTRLQSQLARLAAEKADCEERLRMADERTVVEAQLREEAEAQVQALEQRPPAASASTSTSTSTAATDTSGLDKELHRILTHSRHVESQLATLKTKNAQLQKQAEGVAVLREENTSLKSRLGAFDALQTQVAQYQDQLEQGQEELHQWDRVLTGSDVSSGKLEADAALNAGDLDQPIPVLPSPPNPLTRSSLPAYLSHLRGLVAGLITRVQILTPKLEQTRAASAQLEKQLSNASTQVEQHARELAGWTAREQEWVRSKSEWEEEVRRYRDLLKSYETEAAASGGRQQAIKAEGALGQDVEMADAQPGSAPLLERISLLEHEVRLKEAELARLTASHEEATQRLRSETASERQELQALRTDIAEVQKENASLDEELGKAQERLGWGEFNVEKYNCLVLKRNPVDVDRDLRTKTMDRLKAENAELVRRVEEISGRLGEGCSEAEQTEHAQAGSSGLVPASTVENLRQEIQGLLESIKVKDKAMLRLKQVYTQKASEFRSAIQSLFGFKVRFLENGQVRLNSTFSRSSSRSTSLIFQSDSDDVGRMRLAGEAASDSSLANIPHLREYWLNSGGVRQSVPCFLAALQLELYESTTQAVRGVWSVPDAEE